MCEEEDVVFGTVGTADSVGDCIVPGSGGCRDQVTWSRLRQGRSGIMECRKPWQHNLTLTGNGPRDSVLPDLA